MIECINFFFFELIIYESENKCVNCYCCWLVCYIEGMINFFYFECFCSYYNYLEVCVFNVVCVFIIKKYMWSWFYKYKKVLINVICFIKFYYLI